MFIRRLSAGFRGSLSRFAYWFALGRSRISWTSAFCCGFETSRCKSIVYLVGLFRGVVDVLVIVPILIKFSLRYLFEDVLGLMCSCDGI